MGYAQSILECERGNMKASNLPVSNHAPRLITFIFEHFSATQVSESAKIAHMAVASVKVKIDEKFRFPTICSKIRWGMPNRFWNVKGVI